jgi:hypothetical protein
MGQAVVERRGAAYNLAVPEPLLPHAQLELDDFAEPFRALHRAALSGSLVGGNIAGAHEVTPRVFTVPMLSPAHCARLLTELDARREQWQARGGMFAAPNSMHEHGVVLGELGFTAFLDDLARRWIAPIAGRLFRDFMSDGIDAQHGYLVEYGRNADEDLGFHVDDSEVTLNLCLGDTFSGAELVMLGLRCDAHRQTPVLAGETVEIGHVVGTAILHLGRHRHRVDPIRSGRRRNLIVWCRDTALRSAPPNRACTSSCGWSARRGML